MDEHDLSRFCCLNADCPDHGTRGHGKRTVTAYYGPRRTRMLRGRTCHARFSERTGTPLFDTRLPPAIAAAVFERVAEGVGTRKTGRSVGVYRDTVTRYVRAAGDHAQLLHDEFVAFSPDDE